MGVSFTREFGRPARGNNGLIGGPAAVDRIGHARCRPRGPVHRGDLPPPRHSPRPIVARTSSPGLGRTVCGDGRQVRAEPGFGGWVLARRRVQLLPAPITIRLVRSFAASIGANQLSIWRLFFTRWWTSLSGWLFGERHVQCRLRPLMLGAGAQRVNDER